MELEEPVKVRVSLRTLGIGKGPPWKNTSFYVDTACEPWTPVLFLAPWVGTV